MNKLKILAIIATLAVGILWYMVHTRATWELEWELKNGLWRNDPDAVEKIWPEEAKRVARAESLIAKREAEEAPDGKSETKKLKKSRDSQKLLMDPRRRDGGRYRSDRDGEEPLALAALITDSMIILSGNGRYAPDMRYREFHRYVTRDGLDTLIEPVPGGQGPKHPETGRALTVHELHDVHLYALDADREIVYCAYTRHGEMLVTAAGVPVDSVKAGDTLFTLASPRRRVVVSDPGEFERRPQSVYDELLSRLIRVRARFPEAFDIDYIYVAADSAVMYDKVVKALGAARAAGFPYVSVAKMYR